MLYNLYPAWLSLISICSVMFRITFDLEFALRLMFLNKKHKVEQIPNPHSFNIVTQCIFIYLLFF